MSTAVVVHANPFPGLRPFHEGEEHLFFGRESQVDAMVDKLAATRFLAVIGGSGSGKSSLVNCGLYPALHGGLMASAGTAWRIAKFRPGNNPLRAMAAALARDVVLSDDDEGAEIVDTALRMSRVGVVDVYEQAQLDHDVNVLVVADQFEELFRFRQVLAGEPEDASEVSQDAAAFVNLLLEATEQRTHPIYVVLTMRSDFLGDCTQFPGLAEAINEGQYLLPRLTRDERRAAISGPVGVGGAEIERVLLTRLVNDVGDNPDQLSILQHALNRTWASWARAGRDDEPLSLEHYTAIGTMSQALDQHAEKAYADLKTERQRELCEKIFKALTDKATDIRGVRRPTALGTLCALADATPSEVSSVVDEFRKPSRSFLMPPATEPLVAETVIDISHESLMRGWQRLSTWADEEARSAETYRRLADTAARHAEGSASLLRDPDLQVALDWRAKNQPNETWGLRYRPGYAAAMEFLTKSAQEAERGKRRRRTVLVGLWVASGLFLCLAVLAFIGYHEANVEKGRAVAAEARAVAAKNSALQSLFQGLHVNMGTHYLAGSLCLQQGPGCTFGNPIKVVAAPAKPATVTLLGAFAKRVHVNPFYTLPHQGRVDTTFVVASEWGNGRVIGFAHPGLIWNNLIGGDNRTFADNGLRWIMPAIPRRTNPGCHATGRVVKYYPRDPGAPGYNWLRSPYERLARILQQRSWTFQRIDPNKNLGPQFRCTDALIFFSYPEMDASNVPDRNLEAIVRYVENGGGLFLSGLGWEAANRLSLNTDPSNRLAGTFGFAFSWDAFPAGTPVVLAPETASPAEPQLDAGGSGSTPRSAAVRKERVVLSAAAPATWTLRAALPPAIRKACPASAPLFVPALLDATVGQGKAHFSQSFACEHPPPGILRVQYSVARTPNDLQKYFAWRVNGASLPLRATGKCGVTTPAVNSWTPTEQPFAHELLLSYAPGFPNLTFRVVCYDKLHSKKISPRIEWTDPRRGIYGYAEGSSRAALFAWWTRNAGPNPDAS